MPDHTVPELPGGVVRAPARWKRAALWLGTTVGLAAALLAASSGAGQRDRSLPHEGAAVVRSPVTTPPAALEAPAGSAVARPVTSSAVPVADDARGTPAVHEVPRAARRRPGHVRGRGGAVVVTINR